MQLFTGYLAQENGGPKTDGHHPGALPPSKHTLKSLYLVYRSKILALQMGSTISTKPTT